VIVKILARHNILSAPVFDAENNTYIGMIDMADVVEFVITAFQETEVLGHGFVAMMEQVERIHHEKAKNCAGIFECPWW
jgi:Mg/Co/Ni transporter MgtE